MCLFISLRMILSRDSSWYVLSLLLLLLLLLSLTPLACHGHFRIRRMRSLPLVSTAKLVTLLEPTIRPDSFSLFPSHFQSDAEAEDLSMSSLSWLGANK
jgi:hypothetical protein